jgi:hypothetical protein
LDDSGSGGHPGLSADVISKYEAAGAGNLKSNKNWLYFLFNRFVFAASGLPPTEEVWGSLRDALKGVKLTSKKRRLKTISNCFSGKDAVGKS